MTKNRCSPVSLVLSIAIGAFLICTVSAQAGSGPSAGVAASSNGVNASVRSIQPAVSGLFQVKSPRVWNNGVPAFLDTWDAFQSRTSSAILGKAYAFTTIDGLSHEVLYAGVERASSKSPVVFEFSQLEGERSVGDLRIEVEIDNAGSIGTVRFESYSGEGGKAGLKLPLAILAGAGCNDSGTACVVANGASLEVGANLSQLLNGSEGRFKAVKITTSEDSVVGTFAIVANPDTCDPATDPACPFYDVCVKEAGGLHNPPCTANDVQLTEILEGFTEVLPDKDGGIGCDGELDNDDPQCPSGLDCVTFTARGRYVITTQSRYDIGTFIGVDSDANGDGAVSGQCLRYGYALGDTTNLEPGTLDICGDLTIALAAAPAGKTVDFGPITVPCIADDEGNIVINHCETWSQRAAEIDCRGSDDVLAGTGSKCNCGVLSGICIAVADSDACTTDVCQGTCQNASGGSSTTPPTVCESNTDCTVFGETCKGITLQHNAVVCSDQADTVCDNPDTCVNGSCVPNYEESTTECRESGGVCDLAENCDGAGNCPADGANLTTQCRESGGECDLAEFCSDALDTCPADGANLTNKCRESGGECDLAEFCSDALDTCPADGANLTTQCRAKNGVCDVAEFCSDALDTCPSDGVVAGPGTTECRASDGSLCDPAEFCDGVSKDCPGDICLGGTPHPEPPLP